MNATLPMGDGTQTPDEFVRAQSATHRAARAHVPREHEEERVRARRHGQILDVADARARLRRPLATATAKSAACRSATRRRARCVGLGAAVELARRAHAVAAGHPAADRPGAQAGPAGAVDAVPHGRGVLRRPAFRARRSRSIPAARDVGAAVLDSCGRSLIFGGTADRRALPRQPARAGARPGLLEDPARRRPGRRLGEVPRPDGRQRLRQQRPRLHQLLGHLGEPPHARDRRGARRSGWPRSRPLPPDHPEASLAAFTVPGVAEAISQAIDADLKAPGVTDVTAQVPRRRRAWSSRGAPTTCCRPSSTATRPTPRSRRRNKQLMQPRPLLM